MTPEQKTIIEQAARVSSNDRYKGNAKDFEFIEFEDGFAHGAQYVIENPFDFNLVSCDAFKKEPVAALLTNALLHCTNEQLIALRNGLNERTGDKLFGREEVELMIARLEMENEMSEYSVQFHIADHSNVYQDYLNRAKEWLDNHLKPSEKLQCSLDEQQCRDSCEHKDNRKECPFVSPIKG